MIRIVLGICLFAWVGIYMFLNLEFSEKATNEGTTPPKESKTSDPSSDVPLHEKYKDLRLIDAHNHDASGNKYRSSIKLWDQYFVDKIVIFGDVSSPSAIETDKSAWKAFQTYPDRFIPFFSGFDMHHEEGLEMVKQKLEQGYFGIGETFVTNTVRTVDVTWRAKNSLDGNLPDIYRLCAQYQVPILLHVEPPSGSDLAIFEEAVKSYPDTTFIFAHANVFTQAKTIEKLLDKRYLNLYVDIYAGAANSEPLEKYVPVIKKYPDRFMVSTDSGYNVTYDSAIIAMYQMLDLLQDRELQEKAARKNMWGLIEKQPPTTTQLQKLHKLIDAKKLNVRLETLNKFNAQKLLFENGVD